MHVAQLGDFRGPFVFDFAVTTLVFDLFSGMGGLHHALKSLQIDCCEGVAVIMFEVDKGCRSILSKHLLATANSPPMQTLMAVSDQSCGRPRVAWSGRSQASLIFCE